MSLSSTSRHIAKPSILSVVEGHVREEREKKVVVLRELCRAIIYSTKIVIMTKSHVMMQFTVYRVNQGARLKNLMIL
jgi:ABC-type enterochelin transport system ATPase subunit